MKRLSPLKQKILLTLLTGVALGFTVSPKRQWKIYQAFWKDWKRIDQQSFRAAVDHLRRSKLIRPIKSCGGAHSFVLTNKGNKKALSYRFDQLSIVKTRWDGRWRFVGFDIPEELKRSRNILRRKLRSLGFLELQKSLLVVPYECHNEITLVLQFLDVHTYVRYGTIDTIDNADELRSLFSV